MYKALGFVMESLPQGLREGVKGFYATREDGRGMRNAKLSQRGERRYHQPHRFWQKLQSWWKLDLVWSIMAARVDWSSLVVRMGGQGDGIDDCGESERRRGGCVCPTLKSFLA